MSLYVLRYGSERGKGDYLTPLGRSMYSRVVPVYLRVRP